MRALLDRLGSLTEASESMVIKWAKGFVSVDEFEAAIKSGHGFKKPSHVFAHMNKNSVGRLPSGAKAAIERSPWWVLTTVPVSEIEVTHQDSMRDDVSQVDLTVPLVLDENMRVVDGRHRTAKAKRSKVRTLPAYVPTRVFYRLKVG